ncbi:MAG: integrase [Thiobacillus sp.]|uniref:integrase n=1 Tax=Thiobacillus sp. TaxID=924 RepID=UPI002893B840|nr:integrase [Thiobacillus sp.]MDT3707461.1 integrase [Thiobacillus sp.]
MTAIVMERLMEITQAVRTLPHGGKTDYLRQAAEQIGVSYATLYRKLNEFGVCSGRKQRADAGQITVSRADAQLVSTVLMESMRRNNKRLMSIQQAMEILIANGRIAAGTLDETTGELVRTSASTMARALRQYKLHPDQLLQPAPVTELASLHPNHVWALDASLCVLYYLRREAESNRGLQVMDAEVFYKNKPRNVAKIEHDRVWRYVFSDHTSGAFYLEYVLGAESGPNLTHCFINAIQEGNGVLHGVPWLVMMDPGSANTGAVFKNLARALSIELIVNSVGNARGKGQVEKTHDIVERNFESGLKFAAVSSLDELNAQAWRWMQVFNGQAVHSRTGRSRYAVWMEIEQAQLRKAPPVEVCRELANTAAQTRKVSSRLTISFNNDDYDVSGVPGLIVGDTVSFVRNPWRPETVQVLWTNADGREAYHVAEKVQRDDYGFPVNAPVIGEGYRARAETEAQANAKENERLAMGASTQTEAEAARKGRALAFGGELDPYKPVTDAVLPTYLPKRGTQLNVPTPVQVETKPYTLIEAMRWVVGRIGRGLEPEENAWVRATWPDGVPESELETILAKLQGAADVAPVAAAGGLRLV